MIDSWRLAVGTLTAVPVRPPGRVDRQVAGLAMLLAPLAVLPLAALPLLAALAIRAGMPPGVAAAVTLALLALTTRGIHLDGLGDTADGLAASRDLQRSLEVMRRGDSGPAGVATVCLALIIQYACLTSLLASPQDLTGPVLAAVGVLAGRLTLALACLRGVPAARPDGLGRAIAGSVHPGAAVAQLALALAAGFGVGRIAAVLAVAAAVLLGALVTRTARRRFGGITGDSLGAGVELGVTAALVTAASWPGLVG